MCRERRVASDFVLVKMMKRKRRDRFQDGALLVLKGTSCVMKKEKSLIASDHDMVRGIPKKEEAGKKRTGKVTGEPSLSLRRPR